MAGRTSLSALRVQTPYVTARIPPKRMAVLDFQFEGRVHQPPMITDTPKDHCQPDENTPAVSIETTVSRQRAIAGQRVWVPHLLVTRLLLDRDI